MLPKFWPSHIAYTERERERVNEEMIGNEEHLAQDRFSHPKEVSLAPLLGILVPLPIKGAKVGSPSWLAGKITSYVANLVGLKEVVDLRKFDA